MSYVPAALELAEAMAARQVTMGEATAGTGLLEGARYFPQGVKALKSLAARAKRESKRYTIKKTYGKNKKVKYPTFTAADYKVTKKNLKYMQMDEGEAARFGEQPGAGVAKHTDGSVHEDFTTNVLETYVIPYPAKGTNNDQRVRDIIHLKGVKICANFENLSTGTRALFVNFAVVSRKDRVADSGNLDANMFRGRDNNRGEDFTSVLSTIERHCLPLNTDKYHVWMHDRFKLFKPTGNHEHSSKMLTRYIHIDRQINFDINVANGELFVLYWCGAENIISTTPSVGDVMRIGMTTTTYYDTPLADSQVKQVLKRLAKGKTRKSYKRKRYSKKYARK